MEQNEKIEKLLEDFSDVVNNFNFDQEKFNQEFCRKHRTLQQSMFRAMLGLIGHMSTEEYRTDGRNEQSKTRAKMILEGLAGQIVKKEIECGDVEEKNFEEYKNNLLKDIKYLTHLSTI